jgi:hypothetical protein
MDSPQVIQIGTLQFLLGVGAIVMVIGIAWGSLKASLKHMHEDIKEIKSDIKDIRTDIKGATASVSANNADIAGLKARVRYGHSTR